MFDLLQHSALIREHLAAGKLSFGINHVMTNFTNGKKKALDLVLCQPKAGAPDPKNPRSFADLAVDYGIELSDSEKAVLLSFPVVVSKPVGAVRIALEAKAAMTEFAKARPRLYDELASSQAIVHADTNEALAAGLVIINGSPTFISPTANLSMQHGVPVKVSQHDQPAQLRLTIEHVRGLPRRADTNVPGFDAIAVVAISCANVEDVPVTLMTQPPAPQPGDVLNYDSLINRLIGSYAARFPAG
jgi:hypothetical protein